MLTLLLQTLAAYRITRLIVEDGITAPIRERIWRRYPVDNHGIGYLIACPHCTGVWAAGLVTLALPATAVRALAVAGAVSLINDARAVWALGVDEAD